MTYPVLRHQEYRVGDADLLRMVFNIKGPNGTGKVQLEMKKSKVRELARWCGQVGGNK